MLKIKDFEKNIPIIQDKYELETEADCDYEMGIDWAMSFKDGVFIDLYNGKIFGVDASDLDLLYDLIQDGLVEKVEK